MPLPAPDLPTGLYQADGSADTRDLTADESTGPFVPAGRRPAGPLVPGSAERYAVLRFHAKGGMGSVSVARDRELGREVAFKEMRADTAGDPRARARFLREAAITGRLEHPGIVPVYGLGTHPDGRPFYAMRFVEGDSLKAAVRTFHAGSPADRPLRLTQLLRRLADVCNAVAFAHSRGVIHRDIKPGNIMLGPFGETLLVDWGLAKDLSGHGGAELEEGENSPEPDDDRTRVGAAVGTPAYMSPEQAAGRADVGPATDVYALGATLYELLTDQPPFRGSAVEVRGAVIDGRFDPPGKVARWVPKPLAAICLRAMARDPADRFPTAQRLAADLERWLADEPVSAYREPLPDRARRWARRHRTLVAGLGVLAATAIVGLGIGLWVVEGERSRTADAERKATTNLGITRSSLARTEQALKAEAAARANARAVLDTVTGAVVGRLLASRERLGPDERAFLKSLVDQYDTLAKDGDEPVLAARARLRVAQIRLRLGDRATAAADFRQAADVYRTITNPDPPTAHDRRQALIGHAQAALATDTPAALAALKEALGLLGSVGNSPDELTDKIVSTRTAAELVLSAGESAKAEPLYRMIVPHGLDAVQGRLSPAATEAVGQAFDQLALILEGKDPPDLAGAYNALDNAYAVFRALAKRVPDEPGYKNQELTARASRARIKFRDQKPHEADPELAAVMAEYRTLLAAYPLVRDFRQGLVLALEHHAEVLRKDRKPEALDRLTEARTLLDALIRDFGPAAPWPDVRAKTLNKMADLEDALGRPDDAQKHRAEAEGKR